MSGMVHLHQVPKFRRVPRRTADTVSIKASPYYKQVHPAFVVAYCERCMMTPGTTCQHGLDSCEERNLWQGYLMEKGL